MIRRKIGKKKILIAEDDRDLARILAHQVRSMGFSSVSAEDGREAVKRAAKDKPNLILMDMMMPGVDGLEATRILRSKPETSHIPILAVTALFLDTDLKRCLSAGCDDYIVKPFRIDELERKIRSLVR